MKKGFTLVEMLIVVAILVTLMGMVFRVSTASSADSARNNTIMKLQRLENCLSGYYAAYGSYPPVKLQGSRDITVAVSDTGKQIAGRHNSALDAEQCLSACKAQPIGCYFPFQPGLRTDEIDLMSERLREMAQKGEMEERFKKIYSSGFDDGTSRNKGRHTKNKNVMAWYDKGGCALFKFGLVSYLIPRYITMLSCGKDFVEYKQWTGNNDLPTDPFTGDTLSWNEIARIAGSDDPSGYELARLNNIPSEAVCLRWLPNLKDLCGANEDWVVGGVRIATTDTNVNIMDVTAYKDKLLESLYSPGGPESTSDQYLLDRITICDDWGQEILYYSPPPYQTYSVWSAGANGYTFPPWIPRENLSGSDNRTVAEWVSDDIIHMAK